MTGSCIFCIVGLYCVSNLFSAFNNISYADVSASDSFLRYVRSDDFSEISFGFNLYPSSSITQTGIFYYGFDVGIMSSSIPGTKYSFSDSRNIFRVYSALVFFQSYHLTSLVIMTLFVSGLYNFYVSLVWLSAYPNMIFLNIWSVIFFLNFSRLKTYPIRPNSKNEPMILGFTP